MKVSVVIPTYNGLELLKKNLPAVLKCLRTDDELVIVDDASSDETVKWLKEKIKFKHKKIIVNSKNLRFAASVNRGVKEAKHPLIFLINNDVSPKADVLKHLVPHFEDKTVFAVGCLENEPNNTKGGKNKLWFEKGMFMHSRADDFESGVTAWASGGSAMFSREKWLELGGFDPAYHPAYWEDVDLSYRAKKKGWKILFEAKAVVRHNHESTNQDVFGQKRIEKISWRNARKFVWKNGTLWQKLANILWQPYWWLRR